MFDTTLYPVQVLFLMKPRKIKVEEAFSIILQRLVLRKILSLRKINSFPTDRSKKTQKYYMFHKGEAYEGYEAQSFERYFIAPFTEVPQVQSKSLTNYALKRYSLSSGFIRDEIFKPLSKEKYASAVPLMKGFGLFKATNKGKEVAQSAEEFLTQQEEKLSELIDGDWLPFYDAMVETDCFVFQIKARNPKLYKQLLSMVKRMYCNQPLGPEHDLTNFYEAMNIDLDYFHE